MQEFQRAGLAMPAVGHFGQRAVTVIRFGEFIAASRRFYARLQARWLFVL